MRKLFLVPLCLLGGCATHTQSTKALPVAPLGQTVARANLPSPVTFVETQYEIAGYRDSADSAIWHEPHAVLRRTQVPGRAEPSVAETGPLTTYLPASYAPLPPSAELAAVLEEQRQIASEMRAMKAKMFALQGQAQAQYGKLVAVTTDTDRLRQRLACEEARLKQRENESEAAPNTPQAHW